MNTESTQKWVDKQSEANANPKLAPECEEFTIVAFLPRKSGTDGDLPSFQPQAVKRNWDSEVFAIGDTVTNGTKMRGQITGFEMLEDKVFVTHTWSGIGMNLGSLINVAKLPAQFQIGDKVNISLKQTYGAEPWACYAEVKAVHFYPSKKVKYDLEIPLENEAPTRIYNIDSCFVFPVE